MVRESTREETADVVVLHVGTNHLQSISEDIRQLDQTLEQHQRLIQETRDAYPGLPVVVAAILPRYD